MASAEMTRQVSRQPKRRSGPIIFDEHGLPLDPDVVAKKLEQAIARFHAGAETDFRKTLEEAEQEIGLPYAPPPCRYRQGLLDLQFRLDGRPVTSEDELARRVDRWFSEAMRAGHRGFDGENKTSLRDSLADFFNDEALLQRLQPLTLKWLFQDKTYNRDSLATVVLQMALKGRLSNIDVIQKALTYKIECNCNASVFSEYGHYERRKGGLISKFIMPFVDGPKPVAQAACQAMTQLDVFQADDPEALVPVTIALMRRAKHEGWTASAEPLMQQMQERSADDISRAQKALADVRAKWAGARNE